MSLSELRELVMDGEAWRAAIHGVAVGYDWATELNWTECSSLPLEIFLALKSTLSHMGMCCVVLSRFSHVQLFATVWSIAFEAPPSIGFSRQEYWSGLPFPSPGDIPNPGIEPGSPALAGRFFTTNATWEVTATLSLVFTLYMFLSCYCSPPCIIYLKRVSCRWQILRFSFPIFLAIF